MHTKLERTIDLGKLLTSAPPMAAGTPLATAAVGISALGMLVAAFRAPEWGMAFLRSFDMDPRGLGPHEWDYFYELFPMEEFAQ